jgi:hypothetical protein
VSINFNYPFDIPGHLAGGEGSGGGGADTREVRGDVIVRMDAQGAVTATSDFTYIVNDTVDFVPGDSGGGLEEVLTIPLSRLEATGPSWANDVPFDVEFKPPPITRPLAGGPHPEDPARQSGPRERGAL